MKAIYLTVALASATSKESPVVLPLSQADSSSIPSADSVVPAEIMAPMTTTLVTAEESATVEGIDSKKSLSDAASSQTQTVAQSSTDSLESSSSPVAEVVEPSAEPETTPVVVAPATVAVPAVAAPTTIVAAPATIAATVAASATIAVTATTASAGNKYLNAAKSVGSAAATGAKLAFKTVSSTSGNTAVAVLCGLAFMKGYNFGLPSSFLKKCIGYATIGSINPAVMGLAALAVEGGFFNEDDARDGVVDYLIPRRK